MNFCSSTPLRLLDRNLNKNVTVRTNGLTVSPQVGRRFHEDSTVGEIRGFVTLYLEDNAIPIKNFSMSTNFPRRIYDDDHLSVMEAGLNPTATLYVHDLDA